MKKGGANQGGEAYRMLKGFWRDEPLVQLKEATVHKQKEKRPGHDS